MTIPCVGIFWGVTEQGRGLILLADKTPVDQAESYGDCITHSKGHYEYWNELSWLGAAGLTRVGLPTAPAWYEYEDFPRGRIVYWPKTNRFVIYADHRLQTASIIARIVAMYDIPAGCYDIRSDSHYRP